MYFRNENEAPPSIHTREGLTAFMELEPASSPQITGAKYRRMTVAQRAAFDVERCEYLSGGILLATSKVLAAQAAVELYLAFNMKKDSSVYGLMLTGASGSGKTSALKSVMRKVYQDYVAQRPDYAIRNIVPIIYVEVPTGSTARTLLATFARFLGLTVTRRESKDTLFTRVVGALRVAKPQLIVVDELQNLSTRNTGNGESSMLLKELQNYVPSVYLYAGIDLGNSPLLMGPLGRQMAGRFSMLELLPFALSTKEDAAEWRSVVRAYDKRLCLLDHTPGELAKMSTYLHRRTNGSIGSLALLLAGTAMKVIMGGDHDNEALTKPLLDGVMLDIASQHLEAASLLGDFTAAMGSKHAA